MVCLVPGQTDPGHKFRLLHAHSIGEPLGTVVAVWLLAMEAASIAAPPRVSIPEFGARKVKLLLGVGSTALVTAVSRLTIAKPAGSR